MHRILWWIICITLWAFAILGTCFTAVGILSVFTGETYGRRLLGQDVVSPEQNIQWIKLFASLGGLGLIWVYLQLRGKIRYVK